MHAELLVVGGGPAALAAATAYRDHRGRGAVLLVSNDDVAPYARPPLSKEFLRGADDADGTDDLHLAPAMTYPDQGITLRLGQAVTDLDAHRRTATLSTGDRVTYGDCVLATGSSPRRLDVPGAADALVLRTLADAVALRSTATAARSAVVVGTGFIGCEAAASLRARGLAVTLVGRERFPQQTRLGPEVGARIAGWLEADGVVLRGEADVAAVEHGVRLADGTTVGADLVLLASGVEPQATLAAAAGAEVVEGRVAVDAQLRASVPHLFAAGDVAFAHNATAGRRLTVEHWGEAESMGAIAGTVAAGGDAAWDTVPGFWSEIGDRTLKYAAWGDGFAQVQVVDHGGGAFTAWYADDAGRTVGVLTHDADEDYERGATLVAEAAPLP